MKKSASYEEYLIEELKDPQEAVEYLNHALDEEDNEGNDIKLFLLALQQVIKAQGGIAKIAEKAHKNRNSLYKSLSDKGNPYFKSTKDILHAMGLRLTVQAAAIIPKKTVR